MGTPKTGDVIVTSYGYDATFYDFYKVVKTTPTGVSIVKLQKTEAAPYNGGPTIFVKPTTVEVGKPFFKKVKTYPCTDTWTVKVRDYEYAVGTYEPTASYGQTASGWY